MHKLNRSSIPCPACLSRYRHGQHTWSELTDDERQEVRNALEKMQGRRCAYCECSLDQHGQHIEHFRQRSRHPKGTFDWHNLFWSCGRGDSCGSNKDTCDRYKPSDLIKPDVEDPEQFFIFVADGSIAFRTGLTAAQRRRAEETLRIFNLDAQWGPLRSMRRVAALGYIKTAEEIRELASDYPTQDWLPFLEQEIEQTRDLPFCTTIKHALTPQGVTR